MGAFKGTHDVTGHERSQIASCADRVCGYIHAREMVRATIVETRRPNSPKLKMTHAFRDVSRKVL
jgi:hypothetical protein